VKEDKKEKQYYTGEAKFSPIPLSVSSPVIRPENKGKIKASAVEAMEKQAHQQIAMLRKQADVIMGQVKKIESRLQISYGIYEAEMKFTPQINEMYHLYEKNDEKILSFISPAEWKSKMPYDRFLASVLLLPDKTWEVVIDNMAMGLEE